MESSTCDDEIVLDIVHSDDDGDDDDEAEDDGDEEGEGEVDVPPLPVVQD